jgi:hypothetical protein
MLSLLESYHDLPSLRGNAVLPTPGHEDTQTADKSLFKYGGVIADIMAKHQLDGKNTAINN